MRAFRLAVSDVLKELGWVVLYGALVSLVAVALARVGVSMSDAAAENSSISKFKSNGICSLVTGEVPFGNSGIAMQPLSSSSSTDLRADIVNLLDRGDAGTFVTLYGVPRTAGLNSFESVVLFLGAYADLTPFVRDQSKEASFAVSRDLKDMAGNTININNKNITLEIIPDNMDIYHPLWYYSTTEVKWNFPKTLFVFCPSYENARHLFPDLVTADLLNRLVLLKPSPDDVSRLRQEVLVETGMLASVRTIEEQMEIGSQAGLRTHATYLIFFGGTTAALVGLLLLSLYRVLVAKMPEYVVEHLFGATRVEIVARMFIFSLLYQLIPIVVLLTMFFLAQMLTPMTVVSLVALLGALSAMVALFAKARFNDALRRGRGER